MHDLPSELPHVDLEGCTILTIRKKSCNLENDALLRELQEFQQLPEWYLLLGWYKVASVGRLCITSAFSER